MAQLTYSTEISARPTGGFLVERLCEGQVINRYTTTDLTLKRRNTGPWADMVSEHASTPLGTTCSNPAPEADKLVQAIELAKQPMEFQEHWLAWRDTVLAECGMKEDAIQQLARVASAH